jgi:anti-anti-sigma factor
MNVHSCLPDERFRCDLQVTDDTLIVRWHGGASHEEAAQLQACTQAILDNFRVNVVLDFSGLTYLGSLALGALIGLQRAIVIRRGQLRLVRLHSEIERVFILSNLHRLFLIGSSDGIQP